MKESFQRYVIDNPSFQEGVHWHRRRFKAGDEIVRQGERSDSVFMVERGSVRVVGRITLDQARTATPNVCELGEGEVFGELALFDDEPRSASVVAHTDCQVVQMDSVALRHYMESHPHEGLPLVWAVTETLVQRLRDTNQRIFALYAWGLKAQQVEV